MSDHFNMLAFERQEANWTSACEGQGFQFPVCIPKNSGDIWAPAKVAESSNANDTISRFMVSVLLRSGFPVCA
jgi:hypothetical protein